MAAPAEPRERDASERLSADGRRTALLDVAKDIVDRSGPAAVTMGAVADRAEVTRALVYKHFDNRNDLLAALYRREAKALHRHISARVGAAPDGFEPKLRAFVGACLDAVGERGSFFTPLREVGGHQEARREQRRRDRGTVGYFSSLASAEFGIDERTATSAVAVLFSGIQSLLSQMSRRPDAGQRQFLEDTYAAMAIGALRGLSEQPRGTSVRAPKPRTSP